MFSLSDEELQKYLNDLDRFGAFEAEAETDFKSSERELKLVKAAAFVEYSKSMTATAAQNSVDTHPFVVDATNELREKQRRYLKAKAKLDHIRTVIDVWRTYSANMRVGV